MLMQLFDEHASGQVGEYELSQRLHLLDGKGVLPTRATQGTVVEDRTAAAAAAWSSPHQERGEVTGANNVQGEGGDAGTECGDTRKDEEERLALSAMLQEKPEGGADEEPGGDMDDGTTAAHVEIILDSEDDARVCPRVSRSNNSRYNYANLGL